MSVMVPIDLIEPTTPPASSAKRDRLIDSFREHGWCGRPVLVI